MSASIWKRLGLKRTRDRDEIRRAYARKLKASHPEDNPEGFKALRAAYEEALDYASHGIDWESDDWDVRVTLDPAELAEPEVSRAEPPPRSAIGAACARLEALLQAPAPKPSEVRDAGLAIMSSRELEEVGVETRTEAWLARLILEHAPKSDPLVDAAIDRFRWADSQAVTGSLAPQRVAERRDALAAWRRAAPRASLNHRIYKALARAPGPWTWIRLLSADLGPIRTHLESFGDAPPADMDPRAVTWWHAYFARPRPTPVILWIMLFAALIGAGALGVLLVDSGLPGGWSLLVSALSLPVLAALSVGAATLFIEAIQWPRRLVEERWSWRVPALLRLGWAPGSLLLLLAAALAPASEAATVGASSIAIALVLWTLVLGQPDQRGNYHWLLLGLMLQGYLVIWWLLVASLSEGRIPTHLSIAFAGASACSLFGGASLIEWWGGEMPQRNRLPALALIAIAGAGAEALLVAARANLAMTPLAVAAMAVVIIAQRPVAAFVEKEAATVRHYVMWFGFIAINVIRRGNGEWTPAIGGLWLLAGLAITLWSVGAEDAEVWVAAWRQGRLVPLRPD